MKWFNIPSLILMLLSVLLILFIDTTSVLSYLYTFLIFMIINVLLGNKQERNNFYFFHFYLFIAIGIYLFQKYVLPQYMGLSGGVGVGTDDVRYYTQLSEGRVSFSILNSHMQSIHQFVSFLKFLYPFYIYTPLNIIIFNLLGITFLPHFTYMLARQISSDDRVANMAQKLILFCPYCMIMGLIIMRDMWITTFVVAGIYYFIRKRYWIVLFLGILIAFIRLGSLSFLAIGILIFMKDLIDSWTHNRKVTTFIMISSIVSIIILFYFLLPYLSIISGGKLSEGLFRSEMVLYFNKVDENGTLLKLISLPILLRTPALALFFYFSPFLKINVIIDNVFSIRSFMGMFSPIYMLFLWKSIFKVNLNTFFNKYYNSKISAIVYIAILFALCLGTISLQARHKTVLFPFLYILAAYGWYIPTKRFNLLSNVLVLILIVVQLIFLL